MYLSEFKARISIGVFLVALLVPVMLSMRNPRCNDILNLQILDWCHISLQSWTGALSLDLWSGEDPFLAGEGTTVSLNLGSGEIGPDTEIWHTGFDLSIGYPFIENQGYTSARVPHWFLIVMAPVWLIPACIHKRMRAKFE